MGQPPIPQHHRHADGKASGYLEEDARAEGVVWHRTESVWTPYPDKGDARCWGITPTAGFAELWDSIHGPGAWEANPEIVAVTFEPHLENIGSIAA